MAARGMIFVMTWTVNCLTVELTNCRRMHDSSINMALTKYQEWVGKNADSGIEVVDITTRTTWMPPGEGWSPVVATQITVKFYGRAVA